MTSNEIKVTLLKLINEKDSGHGSLQSGTILNEIAAVLRGGGSAYGAAVMNQAAPGSNTGIADSEVLTIFYDLFRTGHLSWGRNFYNPVPPWFHVTEKGKKSLQQLSRDPSNPEGYLAYLKSNSTINSISESYVNEALETFNNNCYKSTGVMIGCAVESLVLELRDDLTGKMSQLKKTPSADLMSWKVKKILDAIEKEVLPKLNGKLKESFDGNWTAFASQIRMSRNEAGHPKSIEPVREEDVYASLLIFPQLAILFSQLKVWIDNTYS